MTVIDGGAPQSVAAEACDQRYFGALAEGRFEIPRCKGCGKFHFYPRVLCPHCGSQDLAWQAPSGRGVVYSVTIVRKGGDDYTVVLVDLDEGPRLMSRVVGLPVEQVRIGMAVQARIDTVDDAPLLVFTAAAGAAA
ncbi:OB-fold domain-containing protein [Comamonas humi]